MSAVTRIKFRDLMSNVTFIYVRFKPPGAYIRRGVLTEGFLGY